MTTIPITATVDDIDRLTVHFDTDRDDGALFWSWDHDGGNLQAPPRTSFRFPVPGDYHVTARASNGDEGTVDVTVPGASDGGGAADPRPNPTGISPAVGPVTGGTAITITGDRLSSVDAVTLDASGVQCTNLVIVDDNTITCTTPAAPTGSTLPHRTAVICHDYGPPAIYGVQYNPGFTYQ